METRRAPRGLLALTLFLPTCSEGPLSPAPPIPGTPLARSMARGTRALSRPAAPLSPAQRLATIETRQAEASAAHRVRATPEGLRADVVEQRVSGTFDGHGAVLRSLSSGATGRLALASLGRARGARQDVPDAAPVASEHTVSWEHPAAGNSVRETWQAGPLGLEHRVLVRQRPAGSGAVELEISVDGLRAEAHGERVVLRGDGGALAMHDYFVRDARGTLLAGTMRVRDERIVYRYEDDSAQYPVEIDPLVVTQQTKLLAQDPQSEAHFGNALSLSMDGATALIGAYYSSDEGHTQNGAAYVFVRDEEGWSQQAKLLADEPGFNAVFGWSVALSADGSTALVGALSALSVAQNGSLLHGAAYVFVRSSTSWIQQAKLLPANEDDSGSFGASVSLSADGSTALVSALRSSEGETKRLAAAHVFVRSTSGWSLQQTLLADGKGTTAFPATAVALSADGSTALLGVCTEPGSTVKTSSAVHVFVRQGASWTQQQKLLPADKGAHEQFGYSVALSGDGSTALIGDINDFYTVAKNNGAAYVFTRSDAGWAQQQKIFAEDLAIHEDFGISASLSADGAVALVGSFRPPEPLTFPGSAAYAFVRTEAGWKQQQQLHPSDPQYADWSGGIAALSGDGSTALIGALLESDGATQGNGAAYVFSLARTSGDPCSTGPQCLSGFCVDDVCCDQPCDEGPCQVCSRAAGALLDGTCTPTSADACQATGGAGGQSGTSGQAGASAGAGAGQPGPAGQSGSSGISGYGGEAGQGGQGTPSGGSPAHSGHGGTLAAGAGQGGLTGQAGGIEGGQAGRGGAPSGDSGHGSRPATAAELEGGGCGGCTASRPQPGVWTLSAVALGLGARRRRRERISGRHHER